MDNIENKSLFELLGTKKSRDEKTINALFEKTSNNIDFEAKSKNDKELFFKYKKEADDENNYKAKLELAKFYLSDGTYDYIPYVDYDSDTSEYDKAVQLVNDVSTNCNDIDVLRDTLELIVSNGYTKKSNSYFMKPIREKLSKCIDIIKDKGFTLLDPTINKYLGYIYFDGQYDGINLELALRYFEKAYSVMNPMMRKIMIELYTYLYTINNDESYINKARALSKDVEYDICIIILLEMINDFININDKEDKLELSQYTKYINNYYYFSDKYYFGDFQDETINREIEKYQSELKTYGENLTIFNSTNVKSKLEKACNDNEISSSFNKEITYEKLLELASRIINIK